MFTKAIGRLGLAASLLAFTSSAYADGSVKDGAAPPAGRQLSFSANIGATTDYVFRGFSQRQEKPALQGGVDMTYGLFYAGVWASGVDFVKGEGGPLSGDAHIEIDYYAGIKPVWGPITFDFGGIYYSYPGSDKAFNGETLDYFEVKAGAATTFNKFGLSGTAFYSPEYTGGLGETLTLEGVASYELPQIAGMTPSISALIGTTLFNDDSSLDYLYWNAGVGLAVSSNLALDLRYWGTDNEGFCGVQNLCDDRVVATAKFTLQ